MTTPFASCLYAQSYGVFTSPLEPDQTWIVGTGYSYGTVFERDADFWGLSFNLSHPANDKWGFAGSLAFDQETETKRDRSRNTVNSFTLIFTPYLNLTKNLTLSGGFGKGFLDDDNSSRKIKFTNGDWATGAALSLSLYSHENLNVGFDTSLEHNISQKEWSISWDLGISKSF
tara:strand:- start:1277 stop:1795 length:519 start_codon:yes stop_codon:yes gene_type:complete